MKTAEEQLTKVVTDLISENWNRPLSRAQFTNIAIPKLIGLFQQCRASDKARIEKLEKDNQELKESISGWASQSLARVDKIIALKSLLSRAMTLWDNLAEAGQLAVGSKYSETHKQLKSEIDQLNK